MKTKSEAETQKVHLLAEAGRQLDAAVLDSWRRGYWTGTVVTAVLCALAAVGVQLS